MDCQSAQEMVKRLLDWDLSAGEQADLRLHLAACPDCRAEMDAMFALREVLTRLKDNPVEPPPDLAARVMEQVEAAPPLSLAAGRTRAALGRRVHGAGLFFKTPGRTRTALSAAAVTLVALVASLAFYVNQINPVKVAVNPPPPAVTTVTPNNSPAGNTQPANESPSPPAATQQPAQTQLASASGGTMTSVWVTADDLETVNQQLGTAAARYQADYHVYSLNNAPGGRNREFVRITVNPQASTAIMDQIRSSASAVAKVVKNQSGTGQGGQDVIIAWVNGPDQ